MSKLTGCPCNPVSQLSLIPQWQHCSLNPEVRFELGSHSFPLITRSFFLSWILSAAICADSALTHNINIWLPLFWSTWSRARGQDSATCAGLAHGRDYSYCRASEQKRQNRLGHCFSLNCRNYLKTMGYSEGFSTLTPHTAANLLSILLTILSIHVNNHINTFYQYILIIALGIDWSWILSSSPKFCCWMLNSHELQESDNWELGQLELRTDFQDQVMDGPDCSAPGPSKRVAQHPGRQNESGVVKTGAFALQHVSTTKLK